MWVSHALSMANPHKYKLGTNSKKCFYLQEQHKEAIEDCTKGRDC